MDEIKLVLERVKSGTTCSKADQATAKILLEVFSGKDLIGASADGSCSKAPHPGPAPFSFAPPQLVEEWLDRVAKYIQNGPSKTEPKASHQTGPTCSVCRAFIGTIKNGECLNPFGGFRACSSCEYFRTADPSTINLLHQSVQAAAQAASETAKSPKRYTPEETEAYCSGARDANEKVKSYTKFLECHNAMLMQIGKVEELAREAGATVSEIHALRAGILDSAAIFKKHYGDGKE